jgi:hypothetical protein
MSDKVTVFVITGTASSVLASVREMLASQNATSLVSSAPVSAPKTLPVKLVRIANREILNKGIQLPTKYQDLVNAFMRANETVRFSLLLKHLKQSTGTCPSNASLSNFLRKKNYVRLCEVQNNKNIYFWVKKDSAIVSNFGL